MKWYQPGKDWKLAALGVAAMVFTALLAQTDTAEPPEAEKPVKTHEIVLESRSVEGPELYTMEVKEGEDAGVKIMMFAGPSPVEELPDEAVISENIIIRVNPTPGGIPLDQWLADFEGSHFDIRQRLDAIVEAQAEQDRRFRELSEFVFQTEKDRQRIYDMVEATHRSLNPDLPNINTMTEAQMASLFAANHVWRASTTAANIWTYIHTEPKKPILTRGDLDAVPGVGLATVDQIWPLINAKVPES